MSKIKALIVDDAKFMRMNTIEILTRYDVEIVGEAENGLRAVELFVILKPTLVIMDINMPVMDGIESIKRIIKHDASAKIIVCSTLADRPKVIEAIKEGATSYILKPAHEDKLIGEINKIFGENNLVESQNSEKTEKVKAKITTDTDYELGYKTAIVEIANKLINDKVDIGKVCFYLDVNEDMLREEKLID